MKILFVTLIAALSLFNTRASANDIKVNHVVLESFNKAFTNASDVKWTLTEDVFKAQFTFNGQHISAYFNTDGNMIAAARHISSLQLPISLLTSLKKDHEEYWISEDEFPLGRLEVFSKEVYSTVEEFTQHLPSGFQHMFTYMKLDNWLLNYSKYEGIRWSLGGLVHRAAYVHESETAYSLFLSEYEALKICFENFFPDVKRFAKQKFEELVI